MFKFWRRKKAEITQPAAPEAKAAAPAPTGMKVSEAAVAVSLATEAKVEPFAVALHPPMPSGPKDGTKIAMDSSMSAIAGWAANVYATAGYQGSAFMGYPVLAELAQRPEYRMMSETIASEMTRRWIRFTAKDGDDKAERIAELEAEFKRLNVRAKFQKVAEHDGYFGRAHLYVDLGTGTNPEEQQKDIGTGWDDTSKAKIGEGKIKALKVIEPVWVYPTGYNASDPLEDGWYDPQSWNVMGKSLHKSRLITFVGREVSDLLKPAYSFGGVSLSQLAYPYVENWLKTRQGVNDIITSFTQFVLKTQMDAVLSGGAADNMIKRAQLFNNTRSNRSLLMIDKTAEEFEAVSAPLGGLEGLQAQAQEHMASVSHIPVVKLFGIQPAGLNADSDGIMRAFYDWVLSFQEKFYREKLHAVMGMIMLNIWGETDDGIDFEFEPLWSLDEKAQAEVEKLKAETDQILVDTGVLSPAESRERVARDPQSDYASIDVNDLPDLLEEEEEGLAPHGGKMIEGLGEEDGSGDKDLDALFDKTKAA
ncbi:DUF1073 domain-containing protein [Labrys sp. La1]|uniref:DUF1073 domain-containing protein n=1 Tax=Labrys sp. La1 TaxID=3404917 RepID=UPI003EBD2064